MSLYMSEFYFGDEYILVPHDKDLDRLEKVLRTMGVDYEEHNDKCRRATLTADQKQIIEKIATLIE